MAAKSTKSQLNTFDDFVNLVSQLVSEEMHSSWDGLINHVQEVVEKKYNTSRSTFRLDSMYWNVLGSLGGDTEGHITLEALGGETGLANILNEAQKRSMHCEQMISESLEERIAPAPKVCRQLYASLKISDGRNLTISAARINSGARIKA